MAILALMSDSRWERVKEVVDRALELEPSEREAFLDAVAGSDTELRREAASLLGYEATSFMERPAVEGTRPDTRDRDRVSMALEAGARLGQFEVTEPIGVGGMGEVYRARDSKLGRDVAIKVLPKEFAADQERLDRFAGEARLLAQLNHSNIATLHGLEEHDGQRFLVMELVEGETLAERVCRAPIPLEEAILLFTQIADGLGAAHERGIVHRDLKPDNVKLTPEGGVKILDFGLAKEATLSGAPDSSPTGARQQTQTGVVLGTAAYMSPEQARGQRVDKRTDIWAFACCLYEALTGKTLFRGPTVSDTIAAVLEREPDWSALPENCPPGIERLLRRCLEKDPRRRVRDAWDVRIEIEDVLREHPQSSSLSGAGSRPARTSALLRVAIAIAVAASVLATWALLRPGNPSEAPVSRSSILPPADQTFYLSKHSPSVAISPDGRHVAYITESGGTRHLYLRPIDEMDGRLVSDPEDGYTYTPFFSPDGQWLGFTARGRLMKVPVRGGGLPTLIADTGAETNDFRGASWGEDDWIVFSPTAGAGLMRVPADGGEPETLTVPNRQHGEKSHRMPEVLPGGKGVLFTLGTGDQTSFDEAAISVFSMETGEHRVLIEGGMDASYSPTGHVIYARDGTLFAIPFDLDELEARGTPMPVVHGLTTSFLHGHADFSISRSGSLVYASGASWAETSRGLWVDREGRTEPLLEEPRQYLEVRFSPDGDRLALNIEEGNNSSLWLYDLSRSTLTRVAHRFDHYNPTWSPDGDRLAFASNRMGRAYNLFWTMLDGSGAQLRLIESDHDQFLGSWSPDGSALVFEDDTGASGTGWDIWLLPLGSDPTPEPVLRTEFNEFSPAISPDSRWMAYVSDESGREEVYVRPLRDPGGKRQVSITGGGWPRWNKKGRELFYQDGNRLMAVVFDTNAASSLGTPTPLFERPARFAYDVAPDGQHFVTLEEIEIEPPTQLILVQNWYQELERLTPTQN